MQSRLNLRYETLDGYMVAVRSSIYQNDKKHVILVHGIGVSSRYFLPLAEEMATDYNVTTLDLPGYGASPRPRCPLRLTELAGVVEALLEKYELSASVLIGHSMGCQVAAHVAQHRPDLVSKLILLAPTVYQRERTVVMQFLRLLQDSVRETPRANFVIFTDYIRMGVLRYLQTSQWMVRDRIEETLNGSVIPTLLVRGAKDAIVPRVWIDYLKSLLPRINVKEIPGAPHAAHFVFPKEAANICRSFINDA